MFPPEVIEFIKGWNLPGYGIFLLMVVTLIKTWPIIQKNLIDARNAREGRYAQRISDLEDDVEGCRKECDDAKEAMRKEMIGMREQHLAEQLSLVRTIIEIFPDAPQLELLVRTLEGGKRALRYLGEVKGDTDKEEPK